MVIVPVDANINEAQNIAEKCRNQITQCSQIGLMRCFQLQHHDGDDDGHYPITECFQSAFGHLWGASLRVRHGLRQGWGRSRSLIGNARPRRRPSIPFETAGLALLGCAPDPSDPNGSEWQRLHRCSGEMTAERVLDHQPASPSQLAIPANPPGFGAADRPERCVTRDRNLSEEMLRIRHSNEPESAKIGALRLNRRQHPTRRTRRLLDRPFLWHGLDPDVDIESFSVAISAC